MFEHRQDQLEKMLKENSEFKSVYNQHQALEKRVIAAELGTAPIADLALNQMKKEKLYCKDSLVRMMG